jgi:hypothetical protein
LTPERWRQIEELYHSARERGGEALAGADPEICREVEKLLAQDSESGDKLLGSLEIIAFSVAERRLNIICKLPPPKRRQQ